MYVQYLHSRTDSLNSHHHCLLNHYYYVITYMKNELSKVKCGLVALPLPPKFHLLVANDVERDVKRPNK